MEPSGLKKLQSFINSTIYCDLKNKMDFHPRDCDCRRCKTVLAAFWQPSGRRNLEEGKMACNFMPSSTVPLWCLMGRQDWAFTLHLPAHQYDAKEDDPSIIITLKILLINLI